MVKSCWHKWDVRVTDRDLLIALRQAILMFVDALERYLDINPRTSELRKKYG